MAIESTDRANILAPTVIFGGDIDERVLSGDMENAYTSGVEDGWIISQDAGHGVTGAANDTDPYAGSSAQQIHWASTADGSFGFAQHLAGLDTNNDYGLSAYLKVLSATPSAYELFDYVMRVGPNTGADDWQGSASAVDAASGTYQLTELTWSNTAATPWVWFAAIRNGIGDLVGSGGFENGFDANGVGEGWTTTSSPADALAPVYSVNEGDPYAGSSAQGVYYSTIAGTTAALGQQLTGLKINYDYTASANVKFPSLTAFNERDFVFRVGPTLGGDDFQASVSAADTSTASYETLELNWQNTASTVWVWIESILTASLSSIITNGDFESGDVSTGINDAWTGAAGVTGELETSITVGGTSAQGLLWSTTAAGADALTSIVTQRITGLSAGHNYVFTGSVNLPDASAAYQNRVIMRLGPNSGGTDFTDSMTATSTSDPSASYNPWNTITLTSFAEDTVIEDDRLATSGEMEIGFTAGVANGWIAAAQPGITGSIDTSDPQSGVSAQYLEFSPTPSQGKFAIQLTGLKSNRDYSLSGYLKIPESLEQDTHQVVLRVGDASGSESFYASSTATSAATADYELKELSWSSTATSAWIWVESLSAAGVSALVDNIYVYESTPDVWVWIFADHQLDTSERVTSGDFEGAFVAGFNGAWGGSNLITGSANETDTFGGSNSAQSLVWSGRNVDSASSNANTAIFYQNVTGGISANTTYGATAHWKIANLTAARYYDYMFRLGPRVSGGGVDFQSSISSDNTMSAGYSASTLNLVSTAENIWLWFTANYIGPDRSDYVSSGTMEGGYTNEVADGWNISDNGIGAFTEQGDVLSGSSAQALTWTTTANVTANFAQQLTGLSTDVNYTATAYIKYRTVTGAMQHNTILRVGDASGSDSYYAQGIASPGASADYEKVTLRWASSANNAWLYIVDQIKASDTTDLVASGDMEGNYTSGVAPGWIISTNITGNGLTADVDESGVYEGTSAQGLAFSATSDVTECFAQQLTGLSADTQYGATAHVLIDFPVTPSSHKIVFRVGPNSGSNSYYDSATALDSASASYAGLELSWNSTANNAWLWVTSLSAEAASATVDAVSASVVLVGNTAHIDNIGSELEIPDGAILLDDIMMSPSGVGATAVMDSLSFTLSADAGTGQYDSVCATLTSSSTAGLLIDNVVGYSASASTLSGVTATEALMLDCQDWTLTVPGQLGIDVTASGLKVQVNNANAMDAAKADSYVAPIMYGIHSVQRNLNQTAASASDFEANWVNVGDLSSSAYVGNGHFEWVRIVRDLPFTGSMSAFKAYLRKYHDAVMV